MIAISVIIPTFDGRELLAAFLPDLARALAAHPASAGSHQIIVVDNASVDGTADWLAEAHPTVDVVALPENRGFAAAVNAGLERVANDWTLSLNNDIRVEPDFLPPLAEAARDPNLFAAVPRMLLPAYGGAVESVMRGEERSGMIEFVQPGLAERGPSHPDELDVLFPVGGCALLHTARFRELGGFDPTYYPFYWEDIDLGFRAWRRGWTVRYIPASIVYHRHRGTISRQYRDDEVRLAMLKNQILFHWKNIHDPAMLKRHLVGIVERLLTEEIRGDRVFLEALTLALDEMDAILSLREGEVGLTGDVPLESD